MTHRHLDSQFVADFLLYNIDKGDSPLSSSVLEIIMPEIRKVAADASSVNGLVVGQLKSCVICRSDYKMIVKEFYELASDQRYLRGEPPIELIEFDPLKLAHISLVD
ncbi:MAG TPA: hypothetical protein VJH68_03390 [Candidatus Nanoarchaeia archaeon]|nr:hypothetical protein [Candidatus Nanoarchaeia archaeon]